MRSNFLWIVIAAVVITLIFFQDLLTTRDITNSDFVGAALVDVRTPEEYQGDGLPNAYNFPLQTLQQDVHRLEKVVGGKNRKIIIYCEIGTRCRYAITILEKNNFTNVLNMGAISNYPLR